MESLKQLFSVFTNKLLFVEWILQVLRAISIYFLKKKAKLETDDFAVNNKTIDMRTIKPSIKSGLIHDQEVLKERWDLCSGCEFLTDSNTCQKCGCFMKVKHKFAQASCPIGKWGKYNVSDKRELSGSLITS